MLRRVRVLLEEQQHQTLETLARRRGTSLSGLIRELLDKELAEQVTPKTDDPFFSIISMVQGDGEAVGLNHDRHLYGIKECGDR